MTCSKTHRKSTLIAVLLLTAIFVLVWSRSAHATIVRMEFNLGLPGLSHVDIELYDVDRPITTANFLKYVEGHDNGTPNTVDDRPPLYDGMYFHRKVTNFVLQGGGFYTNGSQVDYDGNPLTPNPNVPNEVTILGTKTINVGTPDEGPGNILDRPNIRGSLAMAKLGGDPDSATNQFFFNIGNNSDNLDNQNGGFTTFGRVIGNGMDLIDAFNTLPTDGNSTPLFNGTPIVALSSYVLDVPIGDANLDGIVNIADLSKFATNFGAVRSDSAEDVTWTEGDFNGDGVVNVADLSRLASHFGETSSLFAGGAGAASSLETNAIPEPASLSLLLLGGLALTRRSNKRA